MRSCTQLLLNTVVCNARVEFLDAVMETFEMESLDEERTSMLLRLCLVQLFPEHHRFQRMGHNPNNPAMPMPGSQGDALDVEVLQQENPMPLFQPAQRKAPQANRMFQRVLQGVFSFISLGCCSAVT